MLPANLDWYSRISEKAGNDDRRTVHDADGAGMEVIDDGKRGLPDLHN